ncbi:hypothetical protein Cabys_1826 [Caldithrix abyssi DSM 13497]|uniref:Uncharacterized protein n=1 Tax=Caldithrix abyssi DSM 13497 TaxID=880073 RepID=A0A1J1C7F1_CALAY|nr:hypothetical protein Cabys_1826 [Caldithrix abyssi DSM 13497]
MLRFNFSFEYNKKLDSSQTELIVNFLDLAIDLFIFFFIFNKEFYLV